MIFTYEIWFECEFISQVRIIQTSGALLATRVKKKIADPAHLPSPCNQPIFLVTKTFLAHFHREIKLKRLGWWGFAATGRKDTLLTENWIP